MSTITQRPAHSPVGASGATHECEWVRHPSLPGAACRCGQIISLISGRILKCRADKDGYRLVSFGRRGFAKTVKRHRFVIACFEGERLEEVDHIDRDRANNALENLRYISLSANRRNIGVRRTSQSGIRNVRFRRGKWQAYCRVEGKFKSLGHFETQDAARLAAEAFYVNGN